MARRWWRTGSAAAKSQKGRSRSPLHQHTDWLLALIGERADLTLEEIRGLLGERGVRVGVSSVWRFFDRHGISLKKAVHAAEQQRADGAAGVENQAVAVDSPMPNLRSAPQPKSRPQPPG